MPISLLMALIPIFSALTGAGGMGAALGTISVAEWATIGVQALGAAPEALKLFRTIHPALDTLVASLEKHKDPNIAANAVNSWFANQPPTISGYGADGGVIEIPNPDYRG